MRRPGALVVVGLLLSVSACSGAPAQSASSPGSTLQELSLSDLVGSWENELVILQISDAGDYVVLAPDQSGEETLMSGFVARDGRDFVFVTGVGGECPGQTGIYRASITDDLLTLTPVEDPCQSRSRGFVEPLSLRTG